VAYSGLFLSNWLFFFVAWGTFKLRDRILGGDGGGGERGRRVAAKAKRVSNGK
jgi:hypothetical protein